MTLSEDPTWELLRGESKAALWIDDACFDDEPRITIPVVRTVVMEIRSVEPLKPRQLGEDER